MNSVKSNYLWNGMYSVANVLIPLLTTPYLARTLGADSIGTNTYVAAIVSYFLLFAVLGTTLYGQKQIAYVKSDKVQLSKTFKEIEIFRVVTTCIALLAFIILIQFDLKYKYLYYIYIISFINVIVDLTWFYQGIEDFKKVTLRNFSVRLIHTFFIFLFVKTPQDLSLYVFSSALCTVLGNLSMWIGLKKNLVKNEKINPLLHFKGILLLFFPTIASQIYILLDRSMMGWIGGSTYQIGCYEESEKLIRIAISIIESTSIVMLSRVAFLYKDKKFDAAVACVYKAYQFALMLAMPMVFGLIAITYHLVPVFWGEGFDYIFFVLPILCVMIPVTSLSSVTGYSLLIPIGKQNIYTIAISFTAVVNILLNCVFISLWGGIGAAIASVISEFIGMIIQLIWCSVKKVLSIKRIIKFSWKYLLSASIMFGLLSFLSLFLYSGIITLLVLISLGISIYVVCLMLLRDDFFISNLRAAFLYFKGRVNLNRK